MCVFIDPQKAYSFVDRERLWKAPRRYDVPDPMLTFIPELYDGMPTRGRTDDGELSELFDNITQSLR